MAVQLHRSHSYFIAAEQSVFVMSMEILNTVAVLHTNAIFLVTYKVIFKIKLDYAVITDEVCYFVAKNIL